MAARESDGTHHEQGDRRPPPARSPRRDQAAHRPDVHRVRFTAIRFRDDEEQAADARAATGGNEVSPTVHIEDAWLANPSWHEVAALAQS